MTPGITRRPAPLIEHEIIRVGGRVHAVVGRSVLESRFVSHILTDAETKMLYLVACRILEI
jgi:hypothetical protein